MNIGAKTKEYISISTNSKINKDNKPPFNKLSFKISLSICINGLICGLYFKVERIKYIEIAPTIEKMYFVQLLLYQATAKFPIKEGIKIDSHKIIPEIRVNNKNIIIVHQSDIYSIKNVKIDIEKTGIKYQINKKTGNNNHLIIFMFLF